MQRAALAIILGVEYYSYSKAMKLFKIETLVERREIFLQKRFKGMKSSNIGLWRMMMDDGRKKKKKERIIMPSLVATMFALARITCVGTHYVRTNLFKSC